MTLVQFWTQQRDLYKSKTAALTTAEGSAGGAEEAG